MGGREEKIFIEDKAVNLRFKENLGRAARRVKKSFSPRHFTPLREPYIRIPFAPRIDRDPNYFWIFQLGRENRSIPAYRIGRLRKVRSFRTFLTLGERWLRTMI